jgi:hypothetical protein
MVHILDTPVFRLRIGYEFIGDPDPGTAKKKKYIILNLMKSLRRNMRLYFFPPNFPHFNRQNLGPTPDSMDSKHLFQLSTALLLVFFKSGDFCDVGLLHAEHEGNIHEP